MAKNYVFKGPLSIIAFLWLPILVFAQKEDKVCYVNNVRCLYSMENGQISGAYTAFYANGNKKAEGQFLHNTRVGKWTVWDSMGEMVHQRVYDNNAYDFTVLVHKSDSKTPISSEKHINLERDTNGLMNFSTVKEKEIAHSALYWRMIGDKKQNPALFENNTFFNWLTQSVLDGKIRAYSTKKDNFKFRMTPEELKRTMDSLDVELVGFRTKEMRYYVGKDQISKTIILGLAPIVRPKKSNKTHQDDAPLFWVYMPSLRKELAQLPLPKSSLSEDAKNYDDVFFKRYFSSTIIKESNVYNRYLNDYLSESEAHNVAQQSEMNIVDMEHNFWVYVPETYARK
jgi:hypothetical protein